MLKRLLLAVMAGLVLAGVAVTPAAAGALDPGGAGQLIGSELEAPNEIRGEPWTYPDQAVRCIEGGGIVNCRPLNNELARTEICYNKVILANSASVVVCAATDDGDYKGRIQASGGKPLEFKFGCSLADVWCNIQESVSLDLTKATLGMLMAAANSMSFSTDSLLWSAAIGEWSFWAWAVLVVILGCGVVAITMAALTGERADVYGAIVRTLIALPLIQFTAWMTGTILNSIDTLGFYILDKGKGSAFQDLLRVVFADGQGQGFMAVIISLALMLASVLLILVFTLRQVALAVLVMIGPVAWMLFPLRGVGKEWVIRYLSAMLVLIISGPLVMGMLAFVLSGMGQVNSLWDPRIWPFILGIVVVVLSPFAMFSLFSFAGGIASDEISSRTAMAGGRGVLRGGMRGARLAGSVAAKIPTTPALMNRFVPSNPTAPRSTGSPATPSTPSTPSTPAAPVQPSSVPATPAGVPATPRSTGAPATPAAPSQASPAAPRSTGSPATASTASAPATPATPVQPSSVPSTPRAVPLTPSTRGGGSL